MKSIGVLLGFTEFYQFHLSKESIKNDVHYRIQGEVYRVLPIFTGFFLWIDFRKRSATLLPIFFFTEFPSPLSSTSPSTSSSSWCLTQFIEFISCLFFIFIVFLGKVTEDPERSRRKRAERKRKESNTDEEEQRFLLPYLLTCVLSFFSFEKIVPKEVPTGESIKKGKGCATKWRPPPKRNKKKQNWPKKKRNSEKRKKEYTK